MSRASGLEFEATLFDARNEQSLGTVDIQFAGLQDNRQG